MNWDNIAAVLCHFCCRTSNTLQRSYEFELRKSVSEWITSWWLNQPIWKMCSSQIGFIFPQFSGWKLKKIELPPPRSGEDVLLHGFLRNKKTMCRFHGLSSVCFGNLGTSPQSGSEHAKQVPSIVDAPTSSSQPEPRTPCQSAVHKDALGKKGCRKFYCVCSNGGWILQKDRQGCIPKMLKDDSACSSTRLSP